MTRTTPPARSTHHPRPRFLLGLALAIAVLVAGLGNPVSAAENGETPKLVDQTVVETAAEPEPSEVPLAPTEVPSEPTEVPLTPTEEPTEVPAQPTETSTSSPTETETPPSAGRSSAPAPIPEPTCESSLGVGQWGYVRFTCTAIVGEATQPYRLNISAPPPGWAYRFVSVDMTERTTAWDPALEFQHQTSPLIFDLVPGPSAPATGWIVISVTTPNGTEVLRFSLTATGEQILPPGPSDFDFACSPNEVAFAVGGSQGASCTLTGKASLGQRSATLSTIAVTVPDGWTVTSPQATGPASGGVLTLHPGVTIGQGVTYTFSLTLAPSCDAPTAHVPITLASTLTANGTTVAGPATEIGASTSRDITASLSDAMLLPVAYSTSPQTNTGSMTLSVENPSECAGWDVTISGTDLTYSGDAPNQAAIPVGNMRLTTPGMATLALSTTPQALITDGGSTASYTYPLGIALDIPGGAAAGSYTTTITVNTTSAP